LKKKNWTRVVVGALSYWDKEIDISKYKKGGTIVWQFRTEGYDIGFGLFYKSKANLDEKEIIEIARTKSHEIVIHGNYSFTWEDQGIYILRFDNMYSLWYSKNLDYIVYVEENTL